MVHEILLTVALKVPDNEAYSALEAIQAKMGLCERVADLSRDDLWVLSVESGSPNDAKSVVNGLVQGSNLFVNPNKHSYLVEELATPLGGAGLADDEVAVLVCDRESSEGDAVVSAVHRRLGFRELVGARRWVRWRVHLSAAASPDDAELLPLVRRIAVTESRTNGLLSNPHCQVSRAVFPWGTEEVLAG